MPNSGTAGYRFRENYNIFDINFDGQEIFKRAVKGMAGEVKKVLKDTGLGRDDIDLVVPHQANLRIIEMLAHFLRMPMEKVAVNIQNYGNTTAGTIPIAFHVAAQGDHQIARRARILCRDTFRDTQLLKRVVPDIVTLAKGLGGGFPVRDRR